MGSIESSSGMCRVRVCLVVFSLTVSLSSGQDDAEDPVAGLEKNIPGTPGEDYPIFAFPPDTGFDCDEQIEGYYADPEADCQSFNMCVNFGEGDLTKYSLLCPNGTLFNQQYFICDWWFNVDCSQAEDLYGLTRRWQQLQQQQQQQRQAMPMELEARLSPPTLHLAPIVTAACLPLGFSHQSHRGLDEEG